MHALKSLLLCFYICLEKINFNVALYELCLFLNPDRLTTLLFYLKVALYHYSDFLHFCRHYLIKEAMLLTSLKTFAYNYHLTHIFFSKNCRWFSNYSVISNFQIFSTLNSIHDSIAINGTNC